MKILTDAERYRWLRRYWVIAEHVDADGDPLPPEEAKTAIAATGDSLDYLIDAAINNFEETKHDH